MEYKEFTEWYGVLSGVAFTGSFATFGIFGGLIADRFNRKLTIIIASSCWSVCTLLSGYINSFTFYCFMRLAIGFFESFFFPAAYSIISDYYHPLNRTKANSVFNLSVYIGNACASISQILIETRGWRATY